MFVADPGRCIACGKCVADCPAGIIHLEAGLARVKPEDHPDCLGCQHCLCICPTAAVRVAGCDPAASRPVGFGDAAALDLLMRSRRSVRTFAPEPVDAETLDRVLVGVAHAPTGVNIRARRFTIIRDARLLGEFRERSARLLAASSNLPDDSDWLADLARKWLAGGPDVIFRTAPHLFVVTLGPEAATAVADAVIALSYFELLAQANGIATVWCGMVERMLRVLPATRGLLGIPADHTIGYAMLFGRPGIDFIRTAQYQPEDLHVLERLGE